MAWGISFPGTNRPPQGVQFYLVTPGYFETLGMKLLRGRPFERTDGPSSPRVARGERDKILWGFMGGDIDIWCMVMILKL
jgi:hypothetical protein